MSADIYTKCFTDKEKWRHACELINITTPNNLKTIIKNSAERYRNRQDPSKAAPDVENVSSKSKSKADKADSAISQKVIHDDGSHTPDGSPPDTTAHGDIKADEPSIETPTAAIGDMPSSSKSRRKK